MKYTHLFFDLDHTLWDFDANSEKTLRELWEEYLLAERGVADFDAFTKQYHRHNEILWAKLREGEIKRDELRWKRLWMTLLDFGVADSRLAYELSAAYLEILPSQSLLTPNAEALLTYCRDKGYALHLITNGFGPTQWQKLQTSGIAHFFGEMITQERCGDWMKPRREIFDFALHCTGADCASSLMIGDALEIDVIAAMAVGMDGAFYNPRGLQHSLTPTYEVRDLGELMEIL